MCEISLHIFFDRIKRHFTKKFSSNFLTYSYVNIGKRNEDFHVFQIIILFFWSRLTCQYDVIFVKSKQAAIDNCHVVPWRVYCRKKIEKRNRGCRWE